MGVAVGVGELNQVASCVIKRLGLVAEAVGKLGQLAQGVVAIKRCLPAGIGVALDQAARVVLGAAGERFRACVVGD